MAHTQYACRRRNTGTLCIAQPLFGILQKNGRFKSRGS